MNATKDPTDEDWHGAVYKAVAPVLRRYRHLDAMEQARQAEALNQALLDCQKEIATVRRAAVRDLRASGYTLKEIGTEIGVSTARVMQIEQGYGRAERRERAKRQ